MTAHILAPLLTEEDRAESAEGAIDPLGLYQIADELAIRLIPDVRERQQRSRWLTILAVGLSLGARFEPDAVAADGRSEPWQVFEWYVVEGLVRQGTQADVAALPGVAKTRRAIHDGLPLSAGRYLKTPSVFGGHGIYRALGRGAGVEVAGQPGETGIELLEAWAHDQGLDGFLGGGGPGAELRGKLEDAVADGLRQGAVARRAGWSGWKAIARHLSPARTGPGEAEVLWRALMDRGAGHRAAVLEQLTADAGLAQWDAHRAERPFHEWLRERAGDELRRLLDAVLAYERWSRLLQDAFEDCLYRLSRERDRIRPAQLADEPAVRAAHAEAPEAFADAAARLEPFEPEASQFQQAFAGLSEPSDAAAWVDALLEHHRRVQRKKPPHGKNPWLERFDDGAAVIRPDYLRDAAARRDGSYVHGYRTPSLVSFARDLGKIR